jgi:hypothetical protein
MKMPIADATLKLNKQMTVVVRDITPTQALYLVAEHHKGAGGQPLSDFVLTGEVERTAKEEVDRLRTLYPTKKVNSLFTGAIPQVPATFEEAQEAGLGVTPVAERLVDHDLSKG